MALHLAPTVCKSKCKKRSRLAEIAESVSLFNVVADDDVVEPVGVEVELEAEARLLLLLLLLLLLGAVVPVLELDLVEAEAAGLGAACNGLLHAFCLRAGGEVVFLPVLVLVAAAAAAEVGL